MRTAGLSRELAAVLPWIAAALLWFGLVTPMRAGQEDRLAQQSRLRRDRVKADRAQRETQALRGRIGTALQTACRASADPAALRQQSVAATAGLALSPFTLSVTGGAGGGASVEAEGAREAVLELLRRFGDPGRGSFLKTATVRDRGSRWTASTTTGVLDSFPGAVLPTPAACPGSPDPAAPEPAPVRPAARPRTGPAPTSKSVLKPIEPPVVAPVPTPAPPFALVAFLITDGKARVSLRVGDQIRVVAVGDQVEGWTCASIDRDEGAVFTSPSLGRVVLKAASPEH